MEPTNEKSQRSWLDETGLTMRDAGILSLIFFVLALLLLLDPWGHPDPLPAAARPLPEQVDPAPVRKISDALRYEGDRCSDCHEAGEAPEEDPVGEETEEHDITLEHGRNTRCFNCHHPTERDFFINYDGSTIPYEDVVLLCAKCHGPHYRDWRMGAHGRRNGYWNPKLGPQRTLVCIECHDPHSPHFKPLKPAPGPQVLHGGEKGGSAHE